MKRDLTEGSIAKNVILFGLPFLLSYLLQSIYSVADLLIVSHFAGTYSISGVNVGGMVAQLVLSVVVGFVGGGTVIVAQYVGAKAPREKIEQQIQTIYGSVFILSIIVTILMLVGTKPILTLMQTPAESYSETFHYYLIAMCGTIFIYGYNAIAAVMRGLGDSKTPMYFVVGCSLINVILDIIFVAVIPWGAGGAAFATMISQMLSFLCCLLYLKKKDFICEYSLRNFRIHKEEWKVLWKIALPSCFQNVVLNFSLTIVMAVANIFGVYASAAVGIASKVNTIGCLPCIALSQSVGTVVGQNMGAGKLDRVLKTLKFSVLIGCIYGFIMTALFFVFSKELIGFFTSDPETLKVGAVYFKAHCWDYFIVMPAAYCLGGLFSGTGHTFEVALANTASSVFSRSILCYVLSSVVGLGVIGIGLSFPISTFICNLFYIFFFVNGNWKKSAVKIHDS